ncbi:tetratricopeptide repeat protein [Tundrisphaera lichenicola]|uniref:tetratricopeptide repeat protein n=1 Tax=Tundrisphaera lichenicola TaxID=2029860 RepID=UPI003EC086AA
MRKQAGRSEALVSSSMVWSPRSRRRRSILLGAVAVVVAVGGGLAFWRAHQANRAALARAAIDQARADLERGHAALALHRVAPVPERGPWEADLLTVKGLAFAALDRPDEVRPLLERSLALNPNQPMAARVLAAVYFAAIQPVRGFELLERVARLDPKDYSPWYAAGEILLHVQNRPADAVRPLKEALLRRPDHEESRINLIEALLALGQFEEASPLLEPTLREHPDDPRLLHLATRQARLSGQPEEMNRYAERVLAMDPDDPEALLTRGQYRQMIGRPRDALADAERAVALKPDDPAALNLLARLESSLDLKDRALATATRLREARERDQRLGSLQEQVTAHPDDPEPRWRLGNAAAESGLRKLAINSFRAALTINPRCRPALDGLTTLGVPVPRRPSR